MSIAATTDRIEERPDRSAKFDILVRDIYKPAYTLAYRLTGNVAEAEDLLQESLLRAFRFFNRYDDRLPFSSWLYRIIANAHIDMIRRRSRIKTTSLDLQGPDGATTWEVPDADSSPDREMLRSSLEEPVQRALLSMTPEFRTAVLLADVEGLAYEEVAQIMRTSVGTVRSRIHRGRKQLKKHLTKHSPNLYGGYSA